MDYHFETLGDEKFQNFCQSLLLSSFPNLQCLPVGQPDGGRDAVSLSESGQIIFQVKFTRDPSLKSERDTISSVYKSEIDKIKSLIKKGATAYYLITNVSGTAHPDVGSVDKIHNELTELFGIPCQVWWRNDLERRLDASERLLWRYPELARGQDFLEFFAKQKESQDSVRNARAFSSYLAAQYALETDVKFQQVQIQNNIFDLFTDTSIGLAREKMASRQSLNISEDDHKHLESKFRGNYHAYSIDQTDLHAARWLIDKAPRAGLQRIVLEGAPGQGKSTVTQYLCQVHRAIALKKEDDLTRIASNYKSSILRLPIRVDLRDYALWLTGKDPLAGEMNVDRPAKADDSLESLVSFQIHKLSGGKTFELDSLSDLLQNSHCLLVLDGFDEVADLATRQKLIDQIKLASERLSHVCESLQVIVTSRPAAFVLSPGFSEREWAHLALLPMDVDQIICYTDRWIKARNVSVREGNEFKALLKDRLGRPHIRSLAQNPMQLAILLNLISTKGMSLPDKRTALYDSYMDLFFGREAEKSSVVRENRDILLQIHQYLAWKLQADAEIPGGRGSISQSNLQRLVAEFLREKGHRGDVLDLFSGVVERVGALVSRVQGMLEFEVQPLREYFAGKYLYETAPYSPVGAERHGTKPERFSALAQRPYWANVLRFYSGCYSSGELSSLVNGLEELYENTSLALRFHALQLAVILLGDYVFAQEPRTVKRVVNFITRDESFKYLLANTSVWEENRFSFPDKCGRAEIFERATEKFLIAENLDCLLRLGRVCRMNSTYEERWKFWQSLEWNQEKKLIAVIALHLHLDSKNTDKIISEFGDRGIITLISTGQWSLLDLDEKIRGLNALANSKSSHTLEYGGFDHRISNEEVLFRIVMLLNPIVYSAISYAGKVEQPLGTILARYGMFDGKSPDVSTSHLDERGLSDIVHAAERVLGVSINVWATELTPWNDLIESARRTWGDTRLIITIAAISAGIKSKKHRAKGFGELLDSKLPLAERARYARLRSSAEWWKKHLSAAETEIDIFLLLSLILSWAPGAVLEVLNQEIQEFLDKLSDEAWKALFESVRAIVHVTGSSRLPITGYDERKILKLRSERLKLALFLRVSKTARYSMLTSFLKPYVLKEKVSLEHIANIAIDEGFREKKLWPQVISFYQKVLPDLDYRDNFRITDDPAYYGARSYFYGYRGELPIDLAKKIAASPESFPLRLLEMAESSYRKEIHSGQSSLSRAAEESNWFENHS